MFIYLSDILCLITEFYPSSFSVTSGSPHSQEGNLDTEAGPDIAELDGGEHFVVCGTIKL